MQAATILAIIFGGAVLILAIVGSAILIGIKIVRGGISKKSRKLQADEARMIQEIYQGLLNMEGRVEALETIILDRESKERKL
ncbi:MAG: phage-shock protein [Deltaproteobacteria bacterium]|nr:phage-shock protein [Deltaproteobacteria bacterium]